MKEERKLICKNYELTFESIGTCSYAGSNSAAKLAVAAPATHIVRPNVADHAEAMTGVDLVPSSVLVSRNVSLFTSLDPEAPEVAIEEYAASAFGSQLGRRQVLPMIQ
jgi:hypothetical protein